MGSGTLSLSAVKASSTAFLALKHKPFKRQRRTKITMWAPMKVSFATSPSLRASFLTRLQSRCQQGLGSHLKVQVGTDPLPCSLRLLAEFNSQDLSFPSVPHPMGFSSMAMCFIEECMLSRQRESADRMEGMVSRNLITDMISLCLSHTLLAESKLLDQPTLQGRRLHRSLNT